MKVGWIVSDDRETGNSGRCIVFPVHDWFIAHGLESEILFAPPIGTGSVPKSPGIEQAILDKRITHLIFQKVCLGYALHYLRLAKENDITTVYTCDDFMESIQRDMSTETDILIVNSYFMEEYMSTVIGKKAYRIPCAYLVNKDLSKIDYHTDQFTAFWYGSLGNTQQGLEFARLMSTFQYNYELIAPGNTIGRLATIPWCVDFHKDLIKADVVVLPCLHPMSMQELAKGEGRPVQSLILGIPTVVSPFPDYTRLITNGVDGFVCYQNTPEEFHEYLEYLQDEKVREEIGRAGRQRVVDAYHIDAIAKMWLKVLEQ